MKRSSLRSSRSLATIAAVVALAAGCADAPTPTAPATALPTPRASAEISDGTPGAVVTRGTNDFNDVPFFATNCNGDPITGIVNFHIHFTFVFPPSGGGHIESLETFDGTVSNEVTGTVYRIVAAEQSETDETNANGESEFTRNIPFVLVTDGAEDNIVAQMLLHQTFARGEMTSDVVKITVKCVG